MGSPCLGVIMPWSPCAMRSPCLGGHHVIGSPCHELTMPWSSCAMGSLSHGLPMPWSPYAMRSMCHGVTTPWAHRASTPTSPSHTDIDECENHLACPGQECINTPGSFQCQPCREGFQLHRGRCAGTLTPCPQRGAPQNPTGDPSITLLPPQMWMSAQWVPPAVPTAAAPTRRALSTASASAVTGRALAVVHARVSGDPCGITMCLLPLPSPALMAWCARRRQ